MRPGLTDLTHIRAKLFARLKSGTRLKRNIYDTKSFFFHDKKIPEIVLVLIATSSNRMEEEKNKLEITPVTFITELYENEKSDSTRTGYIPSTSTLPLLRNQYLSEAG